MWPKSVWGLMNFSGLIIVLQVIAALHLDSTQHYIHQQDQQQRQHQRQQFQQHQRQQQQQQQQESFQILRQAMLDYLYSELFIAVEYQGECHELSVPLQNMERLTKKQIEHLTDTACQWWLHFNKSEHGTQDYKDNCFNYVFDSFSHASSVMQYNIDASLVISELITLEEDAIDVDNSGEARSDSTATAEKVMNQWYTYEDNLKPANLSITTTISDKSVNSYCFNASSMSRNSLTLLLPVRGRPLLLLQTLLNAYGKAAHKDQLFVNVVVTVTDNITWQMLPLVRKISKNIQFIEHEDTNEGYLELGNIFKLGAQAAHTNLQMVASDRLFIHDQGFDARIYAAYEKQVQLRCQEKSNISWARTDTRGGDADDAPLLVMYAAVEVGTWGFGYPIMTSAFQKLINWQKVGTLDAYIRYVADLTDIAVLIENLTFTRRIKQKSPSGFHTSSVNKFERVELLFRYNEALKHSLVTDAMKVLQHPFYYPFSTSSALGSTCTLNSSWLEDCFIAAGPCFLGSRQRTSSAGEYTNGDASGVSISEFSVNEGSASRSKQRNAAVSVCITS